MVIIHVMSRREGRIIYMYIPSIINIPLAYNRYRLRRPTMHLTMHIQLGPFCSSQTATQYGMVDYDGGTCSNKLPLAAGTYVTFFDPDNDPAKQQLAPTSSEE